jgi:hypothetical protein
MKNLKLFGLHLGYPRLVNGKLTDCAACAYIYYSGPDADKMYDERGKAMGQMMDLRPELDNHMLKVVAPKLNEALKNTSYQVIDVDHFNMAPHPVLIITRKDLKPLDEKELTVMGEQLKAALNMMNKPMNNKLFDKKKMPEKMPKQMATAVPEKMPEQPQHHYHLRNRK